MKAFLNRATFPFCIIFCLLTYNRVVGQHKDFFQGVQFDSSYCIVGFCQGYDGQLKDSLPRLWFYLDNPVDMELLKNKWKFKKVTADHSYQRTSIDIEVVKDKRLAQPGCIIYANRGILISKGEWYQFDTTILLALHRQHPLRYHTEIRRFDSFNQYAAYGNSILSDTSLLFFFEPSLQYEGEFDLIGDRTNDSDSPIFVLDDVHKVLMAMAPANSFQAGNTLTDSFNINNRTKTKITVKSSKSVYDKFQDRRYVKTTWRPAPVEMKLFWRD